jgi:hypothetical protein
MNSIDDRCPHCRGRVKHREGDLHQVKPAGASLTQTGHCCTANQTETRADEYFRKWGYRG